MVSCFFNLLFNFKFLLKLCKMIAPCMYGNLLANVRRVYPLPSENIPGCVYYPLINFLDGIGNPLQTAHESAVFLE